MSDRGVSFLIFLPGLGDDHRLFKYQTEAFPHSFTFDWVKPEPEETLENYAIRIAEILRTQKLLCLENQTSFVVVCGLSLGGMLAPYVARHLGAAGCIRLCTVRNRKEFPRRYYPAWLLVRLCPASLWIFTIFLRFFASFLLLFSPLWKRFADPDTLRALAQSKIVTQVRLTRMMLDWAYTRRHGENDLLEENFYSVQVHGTWDSLIPIKCTHADIPIERGGHLLSLTHPKEINRVIQNMLDLV